MQRDDRQASAPGPALYQALHQVRPRDGESRMTQAIPEQRTKRSIPLSRFLLFWAIALAGASFDLSTKSYVFSRLGEPYQHPPVTVIKNVLELQTSYNTGALWGIGRSFPYSSLIFAGLSVVAAIGICYWLFGLGAAIDRR